jgi:hypothetical protein
MMLTLSLSLSLPISAMSRTLLLLGWRRALAWKQKENGSKRNWRKRKMESWHGFEKEI